MGKATNRLRRRIEYLRCINLSGNKALKLINLLIMECEDAGVENKLEDAKRILIDTILKADEIERHISCPYYFDNDIH